MRGYDARCQDANIEKVSDSDEIRKYIFLKLTGARKVAYADRRNSMLLRQSPPFSRHFSLLGENIKFSIFGEAFQVSLFLCTSISTDDFT
jgi:hypothetical protein